MKKKKGYFRYFIYGLLLGFTATALAGFLILKVFKKGGFVSKVMHKVEKVWEIALEKGGEWQFPSFVKKEAITEEFDRALEAESGKSFGKDKQLTFELFRSGTFIIDGKSGYAWQRSDSYRDSAFIRSTKPLPDTYKVSVVVGQIDYDLDYLSGLANDPEYAEGPTNENGCYLLAITDTLPEGHHTNDWWHQHRKLVVDVDNNVWGHGMPNPIFMVYFDEDNKLTSFDGERDQWVDEWKKAVEYDAKAWYRIEVEKTKKEYLIAIMDEAGKVLKQARVPVSQTWHGGSDFPEYLVVGDPHENYYQGSMKIKSISFTKS